MAWMDLETGEVVERASRLPLVEGVPTIEFEDTDGLTIGELAKRVDEAQRCAAGIAVVASFEYVGKDDAVIVWRHGVRYTPELAAAREEAEARALYAKLKARFEPEG